MRRRSTPHCLFIFCSPLCGCFRATPVLHALGIGRMSPRPRLYLCRAWLKRCAGAAEARQTQVTKRFNRGLTITTSATRRSVISLNDSPLRAVMEAATDLQPNLDKAIAEALKGLQCGLFRAGSRDRRVRGQNTKGCKTSRSARTGTR
jgi:hypothetical protein